MNIQYIGSDSGLQSFKVLLMSHAYVTSSDKEIDVSVYEINSIDTLYKIPKSFKSPVYFYITTKDQNVHSRIREYGINGILFPPLNAASVMDKFKKFAASTIMRNPDEYDTIKIKLLAKAENIPPLPSLAQELINLAKSDSSTITQVTAKIKQDQGIATRVIKLINSPFYGVRQEINSIDRATVLLGFNSVKNIALAISLDLYYQKPFNMYKTTGKAMWMHSYKVACIAQELAKVLNTDSEPVYMAGLLHDFGKIILADFLVKEVGDLSEEREQLGFDHAEIGAILLRKWSVAPAIIDAVKNHHNFNSAMVSKIVFYANKIDVDIEMADETINEMGIVFGIKDLSKFKSKVISLVKDLNAYI